MHFRGIKGEDVRGKIDERCRVHFPFLFIPFLNYDSSRNVDP